MRWPFGPPHLTLKPSKNNKKTNNPPQKKTKISYQSFFSFFGGCSKFPFFDHLAQKARTKKKNKNRCFSKAFFEKQMCITKRPFLDKKTQTQKFQLSFFCCFFLLLQQQKTQKFAETLFYSVLANLKKEDFQKINWKHRNLKNPFFAPFFWKRPFLENLLIIGHQKTQNDNCVCKKSPETTINKD